MEDSSADPHAHAGLHAGLRLLDRQVVDADGTLLGKVDDLLFSGPGGPDPPELEALLVGHQAFGARLGGRPGRWWTALARLLSTRRGPAEVPVETVVELGPVIRTDTHAADHPQLTAPERWLRAHLVDRLPGARHESR